LYVDTNRHVECVVEKPQIGDFYNIRERQISRSSFICLEWTELLMLMHDKFLDNFHLPECCSFEARRQILVSEIQVQTGYKVPSRQDYRRSGVVAFCALMECYTAYDGICIPTFRDSSNISIRIYEPFKFQWLQYVPPGLTFETLHSVHRECMLLIIPTIIGDYFATQQYETNVCSLDSK